MLRLFSLLIKIGLDGRDAEAGLHRLGKLSESFANRFKASIAGAFSIGAITTAIKSAIDYADRIQDLKDRFDASAKSVQIWSQAAKLSGSDIEGVGTAIDKLKNNLADMSKGGASADKIAANFRMLGLEMDQITDSSPEQVFNRLLDRLASGQLTVRQFAAGFDLLGKSFGKVVAMSKNLDAANGVGFLSDADQQALAKFRDTVDSIGTRFKVTIGQAISALTTSSDVREFLTGANRSKSRSAAEEKLRNVEQLAREEEAVAKLVAEEQRRLDIAKQVAELSERHISLMDEAVRLNEDAAEITERTRRKGLKDEERLSELQRRKVELERHLAFAAQNTDRATDPGAAANDAAVRKELAETNAEISDIASHRKAVGGAGGGLELTSNERAGAFTGEGLGLGPQLQTSRDILQAAKETNIKLQRVVDNTQPRGSARGPFGAQ